MHNAIAEQIQRATFARFQSTEHKLAMLAVLALAHVGSDGVSLGTFQDQKGGLAYMATAADVDMARAAEIWGDFLRSGAVVPVQGDRFDLIPINAISTTPAPTLSVGDKLRRLITEGLTSGEARNIFAEGDQEAYPAYIAKAREQYHRDGETEIDDSPQVSEASGGCYVAAWVWVSDAEAGVEADDDETEEA